MILRRGTCFKLMAKNFDGDKFVNKTESKNSNLWFTNDTEMALKYAQEQGYTKPIILIFDVPDDIILDPTQTDFDKFSEIKKAREGKEVMIRDRGTLKAYYTPWIKTEYLQRIILMDSKASSAKSISDHSRFYDIEGSREKLEEWMKEYNENVQ